MVDLFDEEVFNFELLVNLFIFMNFGLGKGNISL